MNANQYKNKHKAFYAIYLVLNVLTFGSLWFFTELIAYGNSKKED